MAAGAVLFALMNFFARLASSSASWMTVGAVRALIGALVAIAVARMRGASLVAKDRRAIFWRSLFGTAAMAATFYALSSRTLPLADTVTLLNLTPVFLAVLAPFVLRERTTVSVGFAIAIALGGVVLILHPSFGWQPSTADAESSPSASATAAVAVLAAFLASIAMMMLRRVGPTESAESIAVHFSVFAGVTMTVLSLWDLRMPTLRDAGFMVAAGICAGFAQLAMTRAYALERAARVSGVGYLAVVASAVLGAVVLRERPTLGAIAGMALVVAGGLVITFRHDGKDEKEEPAKVSSERD
jgi:drug/metabolite transporter (DMT)-like permease